MNSLQRFSGKSVLITGACGTVGSELVRQLVDSTAERIVCLDNNESDLFFLVEQYGATGRVTGHLADIRDREVLKLRMRGVDVVLHAAALKHVGLCEDSPTQAVQTNVLGTQNVIDAALENRVERVIFTSSDKAVNPTNVMGTSKLMGERLMTAAAETYGNGTTIFASTRFGNVLGSRGSVVPLFRRQIKAGGPITLTDRRMTRFIMTLEEAVALVLESVWLAAGGEVLITKMPVARIEDIAYVMRDALADQDDIEIKEIGTKPGEKMYEELMNEEEVRRTWEYGNFFVTLSAFADPTSAAYAHLTGKQQADRPYNSAHEPALSRAKLTSYFQEKGVLR
ncbi:MULTISPECIES: SDR family NAD(P)-dependent oxidoreductase [unclassified Wenzhouxiangella]|uniref:SDR family NAD(P)-dependent oxidoreductase n=1 Tax=unclassified Wenzhouxiangella TaxID=2613841 RepID=UPI000E32B137|nr:MULTISPECIES: SDR family NAD(P)-dependent oxidoreductase [unclassified Wenzhouxiangella]RFF27895.1 SDR family NAD(P)-dependent oxidoreductase [Wenzhouxiangella sp. 15181]RFP69024.1 SDR family NAD(P)-dependent oxidoreductase [Wenzhouxiangella sp. 15190]